MIVKSQLKVLLTNLLIFLIGQGCAEFSPTTPLQATPVETQTITSKPTERLDLSQMSVDEWASTSPDGRWIAVGLVAFPKENVSGQLAYVRLMIFSLDGKIHWTIINNWEEIGLGFPIPAPLKWSQDGEHFYFTYRVTPDGCSAFPFLTDLQQVSLRDGTVNELLPQSALALALAPDEEEMAYIRSGELVLVLRDLVSGEERETKIDPGKDFNVGHILWSPDGKSLALTLAINPCADVYDVSKAVWAESTTILWVDAQTLQQRVLINEDPRLFITLEWKEPEKITITDREENPVSYLNVNTGEITTE